MRWFLFLACCLCHILFVEESLATNVAVYTETGISEAQKKIKVSVYCDISNNSEGGALVSAGAKLKYNSTLLNPVAEKNEFDWYFGRPTEKVSYIGPDVTTAGEVVFLLGKLDSLDPMEGVSGDRILLGTVLFDYTGDSPDAGAIELSEAYLGSFADFVTTEGQNLDGDVTFTVNSFVSMEVLHLQAAIRSLQLMNKGTQLSTIRIVDGDVTGDGRVGLADAIFFLNRAGE